MILSYSGSMTKVHSRIITWLSQTLRRVNFCFLFILIGCSSYEEQVNEKPTLIEPVDSFQIVDYQSVEEIMNFTFLSDTQLMSVDRNKPALNFYSWEAGEKKYRPIETFPLEGIQSAYSVAILRNKDILLGAIDAKWFRVSPKGLVHPILINDERPYLGKKFLLTSTYRHPMVEAADGTLYFHYFHKGFEDFRKYFQESLLVRYQLSGDTFQTVGSYITKPVESIGFTYPWCTFVSNEEDNSIVLVYPGIDSLYRFSLATNKLVQSALKNPYFTKPSPYIIDSIGNMEYKHNYHQSNFEYGVIRFNPTSQHYAILFTAPQFIDDVTGKKTNLMMVLDKNFKVLKYCSLEGRSFLGASFTMPSGKLAFYVNDNQMNIQRESIKVLLYDY